MKLSHYLCDKPKARRNLVHPAKKEQNRHGVPGNEYFLQGNSNRYFSNASQICKEPGKIKVIPMINSSRLFHSLGNLVESVVRFRMNQWFLRFGSDSAQIEIVNVSLYESLNFDFDL